VIWIIFFVGLACILPIYGQKQSAPPENQKENAKKPPKSTTSPPQPCASVINEYHSDNNTDRPEEHSKSYFARLFSPENLPNVGLFGIGIIASIIAICTLIPIRDQARAAFLSAQAVIDTERPWFVASIERQSEDGNNWRVRITNKGRTPGHLAHISAEHLLVPGPETFPLPPKYSGTAWIPETRFFAADDAFSVREWMSEWFDPKTIWENISQTKIDFFVVYGRVRYRDTLTGWKDSEIMHETRWCYLYRPPLGDFVPSGPAEYNGYREHHAAEQKAPKPMEGWWERFRFTRP
jgi:hypothetical protein